MMMDESALYYHLGLITLPQIGNLSCKRLLEHFGNPELIFKASKKDLANIEGINQPKIASILKGFDDSRIKNELNFIQKENIQAISILDSSFPNRLREINDTPSLVFFQGNANLNAEKMISIIGTRNNTEYGLRMTQQLVEGLKELQVSIVSGLAMGIDVIAHKAALNEGLETIGVVAHGLDKMYPAGHRPIANQMKHKGGILSEYFSQTAMDKSNFPMRNRIVAGMTDASLVIETDIKGGAMITAKLASSYNREVLAVPGREIDQRSRGCNYLIKTNIAQMVTTVSDIIQSLSWEPVKKKKASQSQLFEKVYSENEMKIINVLKEKELVHVDELMLKSNIENSNLANLLLMLEFENIIVALPGKRYSLR